MYAVDLVSGARPVGSAAVRKAAREYRKEPRFAVDLNFNGGEGVDDAAVMPSVSTVNVACGGRSGDPVTMKATVHLALRYGVAVAAHPSYPDQEGLGRAKAVMPSEELQEEVFTQIHALWWIVREAGSRLAGVKPHGALYDAATRDTDVARAVAEATAKVSEDLVLVGFPGSKLLEEGRQIGLRVAAEAFVDRGYEADGTLVARSEPGALVTDPEEVARRAISLVKKKTVATRDGRRLAVAPDTLCLRGDNPNAGAIAREVRRALLEEKIVVRSLKGWLPPV